VAFAFWRRHRALVRALILADTRAGADATEARAKRQAHIDLAREKGSRGLADVLIQGMVGATTREKHSGVVDTVYQVMESAPVPGIVGALEAMMGRPDSTLLLLTIDVPTLIVVGEEDVFAPVAESHAMHQAIPGSRLEIIERAGHVSNLERPAAFNHVMSEFLGSVGYD
jgi:3-oxoadipate enol-lactonase